MRNIYLPPCFVQILCQANSLMQKDFQTPVSLEAHFQVGGWLLQWLTWHTRSRDRFSRLLVCLLLPFCACFVWSFWVGDIPPSQEYSQDNFMKTKLQSCKRFLLKGICAHASFDGIQPGCREVQRGHRFGWPSGTTLTPSHLQNQLWVPLLCLIGSVQFLSWAFRKLPDRMQLVQFAVLNKWTYLRLLMTNSDTSSQPKKVKKQHPEVLVIRNSGSFACQLTVGWLVCLFVFNPLVYISKMETADETLMQTPLPRLLVCPTDFCMKI